MKGFGVFLLQQRECGERTGQKALVFPLALGGSVWHRPLSPGAPSGSGWLGAVNPFFPLTEPVLGVFLFCFVLRGLVGFAFLLG